MFKSVSAIISTVVVALLLTGCSGGVAVPKLPDVSANTEDSVSVLSTLDAAETIQLDKAAMSFGDDWTVKVDEAEVAELKGQFIPVFGDTYSMFSFDGNLVGSEAEEVARVLHGATLYDFNNVERGGIDQSLTMFLQSYVINDVDGKKIGSAEQQLSLTLNFDIKNAKGIVEYKVEKAMFSIGASITITRMVKEPVVSAQDAIWVTAMANEIAEAAEEDDK